VLDIRRPRSEHPIGEAAVHAVLTGWLARPSRSSGGPGEACRLLAVDEVFAADQREGAERTDQRDRSADQRQVVDAVREGGADGTVERARALPELRRGRDRRCPGALRSRPRARDSRARRRSESVVEVTAKCGDESCRRPRSLWRSDLSRRRVDSRSHPARSGHHTDRRRGERWIDQPGANPRQPAGSRCVTSSCPRAHHDQQARADERQPGPIAADRDAFAQPPLTTAARTARRSDEQA